MTSNKQVKEAFYANLRGTSKTQVVLQQMIIPVQNFYSHTLVIGVCLVGSCCEKIFAYQAIAMVLGILYSNCALDCRANTICERIICICWCGSIDNHDLFTAICFQFVDIHGTASTKILCYRVSRVHDGGNM